VAMVLERLCNKFQAWKIRESLSCLRDCWTPVLYILQDGSAVDVDCKTDVFFLSKSHGRGYVVGYNGGVPPDDIYWVVRQ